MADLVSRAFPQFSGCDVADVAGGKGHLQAALRQRGFRRITTIDKRHRLAKGRPGQKYGLFKCDTWERYSLVLGMHPDEATDHIVLYGVRQDVPFVVCPCCIKPDATQFVGKSSGWIAHLTQLAHQTHEVNRIILPIEGDNIVLIGTPKRWLRRQPDLGELYTWLHLN